MKLVGKMKLTKAQQKEREILEYFGNNGDAKRFASPTDEAFLEFLDWSERGIPIKSEYNFYDIAKRNRGITIHELWEKSFYSNDWAWPGFRYILLENYSLIPIPRSVAEFISKEIFAGQEREKIMKIYDELTK